MKAAALCAGLYEIFFRKGGLFQLFFRKWGLSSGAITVLTHRATTVQAKEQGWLNEKITAEDKLDVMDCNIFQPTPESDSRLRER